MYNVLGKIRWVSSGKVSWLGFVIVLKLFFNLGDMEIGRYHV